MESPNNPESSAKTYLCQACNVYFKDFHEWKQHLDSHPVTKYECNFCFSSYSNKTDFWEHIKTHTNSSTAIKYFCSKYPLEEKEELLLEEEKVTAAAAAASEENVKEDLTGVEPLEKKKNSIPNSESMAEHSEMSVKEESKMTTTDADKPATDKPATDTSNEEKPDDENIDDENLDDENMDADDESPDDESPDDEESEFPSADAAAKRCKCHFCDKSFRSAFLFKMHLKKHCLPLTYLQVKCLGEPMSLGILVGKSD